MTKLWESIIKDELSEMGESELLQSMIYTRNLLNDILTNYVHSPLYQQRVFIKDKLDLMEAEYLSR